jgi:hypothetical protein
MQALAGRFMHKSRTGRAAPMGMMMLIVVAACVSLPEASYKLYPGAKRSSSEISIVRLGDASAAEFDGRLALRQDWSEVHLLPGEHTIAWETAFGLSVLVEPSGFATGGYEAEVMLEAGHIYTLRADRTTGAGYRLFFWLRDETAQQIVAGKPKPS